MSTERQAYYTIGPRFFTLDGTIMFVYRIDASNEIGPREATDVDKARCPREWALFEASNAVKKARVAMRKEAASA